MVRIYNILGAINGLLGSTLRWGSLNKKQHYFYGLALSTTPNRALRKR